MACLFICVFTFLSDCVVACLSLYSGIAIDYLKEGLDTAMLAGLELGYEYEIGCIFLKFTATKLLKVKLNSFG